VAVSLRLAVLALLLPGLGCYRATLAVQPASALLTLPDGAISGSPAQVRVRPWPLAAPSVQIEAPEYRPYDLKVRWRLRGVIGIGRTVEIVLVPEHGRAGE